MTTDAGKVQVSTEFWTATEVVQRIREREVSPVEVAEHYLAGIDALDHKLNAYLTVNPDRVLEDAAEAEKAVATGAELGLLHGLPVAVKDLEDTKGLRTTYGAGPYADNTPDADSVLVERLRGAGAIVLGKTNTPAFGLLGETKNRLGDDCRNPWDTSRTTGGSSGGSAAAVASGLAPVGTGTDSAGSITCPAGMCGVFGIKPTHGRVPMWPNAGDSLSFNDGGPLARTVADGALMLAALAGYDARDPVSLREDPPAFETAVDRDPSGLSVAFSPDLGHFHVDPEVAAVTEAASAAFTELGCVVEKDTPAVENPWISYTPIYSSDARASLGEYFRDSREDMFAETLREIEGIDRITGADVVVALGKLARFRADMAEFFSRYDILLTPATAVPAFPVGEPPAMIDAAEVEPGWTSFMPFQIAWNMTGQPVANVPCGFTKEGLPLGMLVIGPVGGEELVLSAAAGFERARPWAGQAPPVVGS